MANQTLETFFAEQREKYTKQAEDARAQLTEAEAELRALDAYEQAKKGKPSRQQTNGEHKTRKPRETGKRAEILKFVTQFPDGATSAELQDKLGIRGDKTAVQSLSNALSALKKAGQITLHDGRYTVPAPA